MIKKKVYFLLFLIMIVIPSISAYTLYNASAEQNVIFRSLGLNSQITTTFEINFSRAEVNPTNITFYDLTYFHPLSCNSSIVEEIALYSYTTTNSNITTNDLPYTACNPPNSGSSSGSTSTNISVLGNYSVYDILVSYNNNWTFNKEQKITIYSTYKGDYFNLASLMVKPQDSIDYDNTPYAMNGVGKYVYTFIIPEQNISSIIFDVIAISNGTTIIKTFSVTIDNGKYSIKNLDGFLPKTIEFIKNNPMYFIAILIALIVVIIFVILMVKHNKKRSPEK